MAASMLLKRVLVQVNLSASKHTSVQSMFPRLPQVKTTRKQRETSQWRPIVLPEPGKNNIAFRRIVNYKDHYTVEPLKVTNLAGRDPYTGRVVCMGIGGGIKEKYHQIKWIRDGPTEGPPKEERVLSVFKDGCRTGFVALVGSGKELKYIIATVNMKPGDIIKTSREIPRIPVRCNEGDAYPLGALPIGTFVNCVEKYPGKGAFYLKAAGAKGAILRKDGDHRVVIRLPGKRPIEYSFDEKCMATVGQISNVIHGSTHIGSAQRNRELGNRPRSGLWQRKDGRFGRKIKRMKPLKKVVPLAEPRFKRVQFTLPGLSLP